MLDVRRLQRMLELGPPGETMVQVPDTDAERLSVRAFRRELGGQDALFDLMGRYAQPPSRR
jgi:hypothetical protein